MLGWLRRKSETGAAEEEFRAALAQRWAAYGDEVRQVAPSRIRTGTIGGFEYTAFDAMIKSGGLRERRDSVRTISMVHLPMALPDVRLRPRLRGEEELGPMPAVALEPPWNCDILPRLRAVELFQSGDDPTGDLTAEADVPGLAEELVTGDVVDMSVLCGLIHWRVHARDLIFVSFPGAGVIDDVTPTVTNLAHIAQKFPQVTLRKYGA
jgi:hypothetical protein